jgi:PAS domain S-box-containing protein
MMSSAPPTSFLQSFDPRYRFGARIGWVVGIIVLIIFVVFSLVIGEALRQFSEHESGADFAELAFQMTDKLDRGMFERYREIEILASLNDIRNAAVPTNDKRALLEQLQATLPEYAWLGITNPDGSVLVATGGLLEGEDVSQRPWFINAQSEMFVGDVHEALLLASLLPNETGEPLRFVDVASPLFDEDGAFIGVLGAHLSWSWVESVRESVLQPLQDRSGIEMLVLSRDEVVLLGTPEQQLQDMTLTLDAADTMAGSAGYFVTPTTDAQPYLVGFATTQGYGDYPGLGWRVAVRKPLDAVLAEAYTIERNILLAGMATGLVSAGIAGWIAQSLVKPVTRLALAADKIKHGDDAATIPIIAGKTEVASLSQNVASLVQTLALQNQDLESAADRFRVLHTIDRTVLGNEPAETVARLTLTFLASRYAYRFARVVLFDEAEGKSVLSFLSNDSEEPSTDPQTIFPLPQVDADLFRDRQDFYAVDLANEKGLSPALSTLRQQGIRTYLIVPLIAKDSLIGGIHLAANEPNAFSQEFMEVAHEVADQLAIAIQQARYREEIALHTASLEARVRQRTVELAEARDRAEAILSHDSDPIAILQPDGRISQINPAFQAYFGDDEQLIGRVIGDVLTLRQHESLAQALAAVNEGGTVQRLELGGTRRDGQRYVADVALSPVLRHGDVTTIIFSLRDITMRQQIETDVRAALDKQRELNEVKTRFTSMVSHEFRTPLSVIKSSASLVERYRDRLSPEKQQEYLGQIHEQVKHLVDMLDDVLTISRAEAVGVEAQLAPTDLVAFAGAIVDEMQQTTVQHQVLLETTGKAYPVWLDTKLMRQVLENLLSNAIKYSPAGGVVQVEIAYEAAQVVLRVRDNGIGIPQADQARLFEGFQRATNVGDIAGTGLGLSIVKLAVDAHGGTIDVESVVGQGATFTVRLPSVAASGK